MDKHIQSTFKFNDYRLKNIQLDWNEKFEPCQPIEIDFTIDVEIVVNEDCSKATVVLHSKVFENAAERNLPFSLTISIKGFFSYSGDATRDELRQLCEINGTATLFPFLRAAIADTTRIANIDPLILPLVNIYQLMEKKKEKNDEENIGD